MLREEKIDELRGRLNDETGIANLIDEITVIPSRIKQEQLAMQILKEAILKAEESITEIEAEVLFEVTNETNGNPEKPKPKFSNESMRKAETQRRLKENLSYGEAMVALGETKSQEQKHLFEIDRLRRELQVKLAIKDLAVAQINLYSGIGGIQDGEQKEK